MPSGNLTSKRNKMKHVLPIALVLTLLSCSNDDVTALTELNGKWVDINTKTDTLTFGLFGGQESMILGRGKETRGGFLLPKYGSGPYDYEVLTRDKISLLWTLSSNSNPKDYYFKQTGDKLVIEKFFDTTTSGTILTFKKIN
jgi:hypothetical protein